MESEGSLQSSQEPVTGPNRSQSTSSDPIPSARFDTARQRPVTLLSPPESAEEPSPSTYADS